MGRTLPQFSRPDLKFRFYICFRYPSPHRIATKHLSKVIGKAHGDDYIMLCFVLLDTDSIELIVPFNANFATNCDMSSQVGLVVALLDKDDNGNILHYSGVKRKQITRSVLAAELCAATQSLDHGTTFKTTSDAIMDRVVPLTSITECESLYTGICGISSNRKKNLLIDLCMLHESNDLRELINVAWIPFGENPADATTKNADSPASQKPLKNSRVAITAKS